MVTTIISQTIVNAPTSWAPTNTIAAFRRLSSCVEYYRPPVYAPRGRYNDPSLIILCTWLNASPRHISKYTDKYVNLYPASRLLLVTCSTRDYVSSNLSPLRSALSVITAFVDEYKCLAHIFSFGGAHQLKKLAMLNGKFLPIRGLILDSCPVPSDIPSVARSFAFAVRGLPWYYRLLALTWIYIRFVFVAAIMLHLLGIPNTDEVFEVDYKSLVDCSVTPARTTLTYLYGTDDGVVSAEDVEAHAKMARRVGKAVRMERFEGTKHVNHAKGDEERYWKAVKRTWAEYIMWDFPF
ncbi:hypothetical protein BZA05DRAFT_393037 [Tricharina praecox]|uniref:uncharacterized protein n=1 Tax=Tricharina praecox TaxID=43433 RepID=UPI00221E6759|nr:uncharacterized protein BZA05DRAFT_393037 [Tricharina praecox]KAI5854946.1 hypothetical protein BZA05DRAFT_393037 [Tricharina praecox]